ncbi:MarR family transcriptional regulator [Vibrio owensii]|uniref:MarR family transcriptional regulator n=1 Tax=Vibrio owensii TaxID=696485 RepID=UPI000587B3C8|nr:helix-turn-helix domain-containing protein [Vibrio owensii]
MKILTVLSTLSFGLVPFLAIAELPAERAGSALARLEAFSMVLCRNYPTPNTHEIIRRITEDSVSDYSVLESKCYINKYQGVYFEEESRYLRWLNTPEAFTKNRLSQLCMSYDKRIPNIRLLLSLYQTITLRQLSVLLFIAEHPDCTTRIISERMGIPFESTYNIVKQLTEEADLIELKKVPENETIHILHISNHVKEILI